MAAQPPNPASEKTGPNLFNIRIACPHCELVGIFSLDRLKPNTRVRCQRCDQWFRIEARGKTAKVEAPDAAITVAVRGALSEWREHLAPESGRLERRSQRPIAGWKQYVGWRSGIVAGLILVAAVGLAWRLGSSSAEAAAYQEPEALTDRAAAFGLAWVCNDQATMNRFRAQGSPTVLSDWIRIAGTRLAPGFDDARPDEVIVETVSVAPEKDPSRAIVTIGLQFRGGPPPPKGAVGYTHRQAWNEIDGKWLFLPEESLKLLQTHRR